MQKISEHHKPVVESIDASAVDSEVVESDGHDANQGSEDDQGYICGRTGMKVNGQHNECVQI